MWGKLMPAKRINLGLLCNTNSRLKCSENFDEEARKNIFEKYYKLDQNAKNNLLF